MEQSIDNLYCPITLQLFLNPVFASDGHIYEKDAIKKCTVSPLTREPLKTSYIKSIDTLNKIENLLVQNPDMWLERYAVKYNSKKYATIYKKHGEESATKYLLTTYDIDSDTIRYSFKNNKYSELKYVEIIIEKIITHKKMQYITFGIEHWFDYETSIKIINLYKYCWDRSDILINMCFHPHITTDRNICTEHHIHDLCTYRKIIKCMLENTNININIMNDWGKTAIENASHCDIELTKMLVDYGATYKYTCDKPSILHSIVRYTNPKLFVSMFEYFVEELKMEIDIPWTIENIHITPLFIACILDNFKEVDYLVSKGGKIENVLKIYESGSYNSKIINKIENFVGCTNGIISYSMLTHMKKINDIPQ